MRTSPFRAQRPAKEPDTPLGAQTPADFDRLPYLYALAALDRGDVDALRKWLAAIEMLARQNFFSRSRFSQTAPTPPGATYPLPRQSRPS